MLASQPSLAFLPSQAFWKATGEGCKAKEGIATPVYPAKSVNPVKPAKAGKKKNPMKAVKPATTNPAKPVKLGRIASKAGKALKP